MKAALPLATEKAIRTFIHLPLLYVSISILSGCTTSLEHVDLQSVNPPTPGNASVYVIRPAYLSYAARDLTVTANKIEVADLSRLSYTAFEVPSGVLKLSGEGTFFSWPLRELTIKIEDGKTYFIAWKCTETASSALMLMLFPKLDKDSPHWEVISKSEAQGLMDSIGYIVPDAYIIPDTPPEIK